MAKRITAKDLFEKEDLFQGIRESISQTLAKVKEFDSELKSTAVTLEKTVKSATFDTTKGINDFVAATEKAEKAQKESITVKKAMIDLEKQQVQLDKELQKLELEKEKVAQAQLKTAQAQSKADQKKAADATKAAKAAQNEASAYKQLEKSTRELKNQSKELAAQLVQLEREGKRNTAEFREMSKQYRDTTKAAKQADVQLKQIDQRVGDNFRNVGNYSGAVQKLSNGLGMLGVSFGIGSIVSSATTKVIEFDQAIADLQAITGASGSDLEFYKQQANELGIAVEGGGSAVVEAYKLIGSAKPELLANADALNEVTKSAILLSQASGMQLPDAATALTDAMNQFAAPAEQAGKFIDVLANGAKYGSAEIPQITDALLKFGAVAKTSNVSIEESTALIELLAEKGLKGADAGTALRNVMLKLSAPDALPKEAKDRLDKLGISFATLNNESLPFSKRLAELKPLLNDNAALVKTFGTENAVAATSLLNNIDRIDELEKSMHNNGTATEQATQRTATLGHALTELKNSFFSIFTEIGSGNGTMNVFIGSLQFLAKNMGTIMSVLGKMVASFVLYKTTLASIKAYQFIMSGGLKDLGKQLVSNISLTKQAANSTKQMGDSAVEAGQKAGQAGRAIQAIPWTMIIGLLIEVATKWYDVASGAAEARRQAELTQQFEQKFQIINDKNASKRAKNLANELADLQRQRNERKISEIEFRKQSESITKKYKGQAEMSKQSTKNQIKDLKQLQSWVQKTRKEQEKDFEKWAETHDQEDEMKKMQSVYEKMGYDSGTAWFGLLQNANQGFADLDVQLTSHVNALNKVMESQTDEIDGLNQQYLDAASSTAAYGVEIKDNSGLLKDNTKEVKKYKTELNDVNDYLQRQIDLMQQLNVIQQQRSLLSLDTDIEAAIDNAVKLVKETGTIDVGVQSNTETGQFGSMYDPIEQMIIDRYEKEREFINQRTQFAIDELQRQFDREIDLEKQKLIDERNELLSQEKITDEAKQKINDNYNLRLKQLEVEQKERAVDLELDKRLLSEKTIDDLVKLEETKNDKINEYNEKLLTGEEEFNDEKLQNADETNKKIIESEKQKFETISQMVKMASDFFVKQSERKVAQLEKEISAAQNQYSVLQELAKNGNINAQQSLAEQQRIINEANLKKERELKRQERIKLAESVWSTYSNKLADEKVKNPLAETIRDTVLLSQFINSLPAFEKGTEDTGINGKGVDGKGGFHAILHPNERVVPKTLNEKIGSMTNEQLATMAQEYQNGKIIRDGMQIASAMDTLLIANKIDELNATIRNKPETNIEMGEITSSIMEVVKSTKVGNTVTYNKFKVKR